MSVWLDLLFLAQTTFLTSYLVTPRISNPVKLKICKFSMSCNQTRIRTRCKEPLNGTNQRMWESFTIGILTCPYMPDIIHPLLTLNSSMILRMAFPRAPIMRAWTRWSRVMSSETICSSSPTIFMMASRAASVFFS